MYKIIANNTEFMFHDINGATLSINILERFNIPYILEKIGDI